MDKLDKLNVKLADLKARSNEMLLKTILACGVHLDYALRSNEQLRRIKQKYSPVDLLIQLMSILCFGSSVSFHWVGDLVLATTMAVFTAIFVGFYVRGLSVQAEYGRMEDFSGTLNHAIGLVNSLCNNQTEFSSHFMPFRDGVYESERECAEHLVLLCKQVASQVPGSTASVRFKRQEAILSI